jgi:hypothetical protein
VSADYNARCDPTYVDRVLTDLVTHPGELRHLEALYGGDCRTVRDAVVIGRHHGLLLESAGQGRVGYCCVGFARPASRVKTASQPTIKRDLSYSDECDEPASDAPDETSGYSDE